ncbi:MAG TPA: hypothetical protein VEZ55_14655 [Chitinophagaceae bacterium]|nr:hypothetical protein [Chitinophagaceae bacterium]
MSTNPFIKAGILTIVLLTVFLIGWELTWRSKGFFAFYDDNAALWADKRAKVYKPQQQNTVFIGSSRIKFDLDIPTWKKITGEDATQLAIVGSSPLLLLEDLANDENFKGKLVVDVTEPLYFSGAPPYTAKPAEFTSYFKKRTPTQKFSFEVSRRLESQFTFLNQEYLSINGLLNQVTLPARKDVFVFPYFPHQFEVTNFERQSLMLDEFVRDSSLQKQMQDVWQTLMMAGSKMPPTPPEAVEAVFTRTTTAVNKIRARGGRVLFVRTPSSNPMWQGEQMGFPREKFWNRLLNVAKAEGIHFADYDETSGFICPEWSHLSPADAIVYTKHLARHIESKGWKFPNTNPAVAQISSH